MDFHEGQAYLLHESVHNLRARFMIGTVLAVIAYKKKHSENRVSGSFAERARTPTRKLH